MSTCFFIGHREAPETLMGELTAEVERHINEYGVTDFVVGRYGRFDGMAAKSVKAAKKRHPEVTLTLLLPYHPYDRPTPTPPGFDGMFYPPGMETVPKRAAIVRANQYMVDNSDYLIAYVRHSVSNAWNLVEYAKRYEKQGRIKITLLPQL
jgi:hypothetical protein